jgi:Flp pilus assembly protein TadB
MDNLSWLMVVKVLGIAALGGGFVWWQFRDLAREKKRSEQRKAAADNEPHNGAAPR